MLEPLPFGLLADIVLALHVALVAFVVGGLVMILAGNLRRWRWVNNLWFRLTHLAAIAVVVAQSWLGKVCPLTTFELWLRAQSGAPVYGGTFIEHWLQRLLYYDLPPWAFVLAYTLFGVAVAAAWWYFPPAARHRPAGPRASRRNA